MSIRIFAMALAACCAFAVTASDAFADGIDISVGDRIRLYDGTGNGSGGEFDAVLQEWNGSKYVAKNPSVEWSTFCLEADEYFQPGRVLRVVGVSTFAWDGGTNTDDGDDISLETAWLYTQMWNGTLTGLNEDGDAVVAEAYDGANHARNATWLQKAIWELENESLGADNYYIDLAEQAVAAGWNSIGQVRVLNLERKDRNGNWIRAQDQLVMTNVPEPGSIALLGLGLAGLAFARSRRRPRGGA